MSSRQQKKSKTSSIPIFHSYSNVFFKYPGLNKNSICKYDLNRVHNILTATTDPNKFVLKVDFMELEFQQNLDNTTIAFSQKLPPVSFHGELDTNLSTIDIPIEYQLQTDSVTLKYYFSDFTKIRERLNDFIRACSAFYTVYCKQPSLIEKEDGLLEVKWS